MKKQMSTSLMNIPISNPQPSHHSEKPKTRRELLREKVNNLADFCIKLKPEVANDINRLKNSSDEEVIYWIVNDILPRQKNLHSYVDDLMKHYQLPTNEETKNKLLRYCQFFIRFLDK
jgi:hypothetical protein